MIYDYSKLRGKIREKFTMEKAFAEALGISAVTLSTKLNNRAEFTQNEMNKSCSLLGIPKSDLPLFFYEEC